jgi:hypothetical protein
VPGTTSDPFTRLGLLALAFCVLLMGTEYAATTLWLPRQTGHVADPKSPSAVSGIGLLNTQGNNQSLTLSQAIRAAAAQRRAIAESAGPGLTGDTQLVPADNATVPAGSAGPATPVAESAQAGKEPSGSKSNTGTGPGNADSSDEELAAAQPPPPEPPMAVLRKAAILTAGLVVVHPVTAKEDEQPRYPLREEYEWLERCRLPSGALSMAPGDRRINPYFSNLAAMALLHWNPDAVRDWIVWYMRHLNEVDRFGLRGTIYDYQWVAGREVSDNDYDSADSYAATFLTVVARYFFTTGDGALVVENLQSIETVAGVILTLLDEDDLTWAKADRRYKFLMDNAEVYRGLADWAEVLRTLGFWRQGDLWASYAERVRVAIDRELWMEDKGAYSWAKTALGPRAIRRRWYPDTTAQLFPIFFGLIDPNGPRAKSLIAKVNSSYPGWPSLSTGDQFPWAMTAYVNAAAGDREMAMRFLDTVWDRHLSTGRAWPWYNAEAAFLIFTVLELADAGSAIPPRR